MEITRIQFYRALINFFVEEWKADPQDHVLRKIIDYLTSIMKAESNIGRGTEMVHLGGVFGFKIK